MNCSGINAVAIVTVTASGTQYSENTEKNENILNAKFIKKF